MVAHMSEAGTQEQEHVQKFVNVSHTFLRSMDAIIELRDFSEEHARLLDDPVAATARIASRWLPNLEPEQHREAADLTKATIENINERARELTDDGVDTNRSEAIEEAMTPIMADWRRQLSTLGLDTTGLRNYLLAYAESLIRPARVPLLHSALLISAVGNFEVLVSGLVREFIRLKPEILRSDEVKYSLAEIEGFESLTEFREYCSERYAEALLRGGLDDWMAWFERRLKVSLGELPTNFTSVVEVFQRRHLFVHNGGVVNRSYLVKVPNADLRIGQRLEVDAA